jgi:hypothetical protein
VLGGLDYAELEGLLALVGDGGRAVQTGEVGSELRHQLPLHLVVLHVGRIPVHKEAERLSVVVPLSVEIG